MSGRTVTDCIRRSVKRAAHFMIKLQLGLLFKKANGRHIKYWLCFIIALFFIYFLCKKILFHYLSMHLCSTVFLCIWLRLLHHPVHSVPYLWINRQLNTNITTNVKTDKFGLCKTSKLLKIKKHITVFHMRKTVCRSRLLGHPVYKLHIKMLSLFILQVTLTS